jgi:DNA-binding transcriptional LysR family regulator
MLLTIDITEPDMPRNLDLTALRSFVAVADAGGVTRAAGFLHVTQSAVSMQLKRLEDAMGVSLIDRSSRRIAMTAAGEQLLGYARRMLALNDEVLERLTADAYVGEVRLGVPHDVVYPAIPQVLRQFAADFPRVRVVLHSSYTSDLLELFGRGDCEVILATEDGVGAGGETIAEGELVWVGAPGGTAWKHRPLRLAFETRCIFRQSVQDALERADIKWEMAIESEHSRTIEASLSADLAVHAMLAQAVPPQFETIRHGGALPPLPRKRINLYISSAARSPVVDALTALVRQAYSG